MRALVVLLAAIAVLTWLGIELREKSPAISQVLFGFAALFAVVLAAAFFELI